MGANSAGLSSKMSSFESIINNKRPSLFFLQETKMRREGKIKLGGYQIYELVRSTKFGGGLAIGALDEINPAFISDGDDITEILVVEVKINGMQVRCINGYAPQENDSKDKKQKFWNRLKEEVDDADKNDKAVIIQMDGNLHAGPEIIPGDPNKCNINGRLLREFIEKCPYLTIINATNLCEKVITRRRIANNKVEEAALDFFITCRKILPLISRMEIDDVSKLTRFSKSKTVPSDHDNLFLYLNSNIAQNSKRVEIFNLKDAEAQDLFKIETSNFSKLTECFLKPNSLEDQTIEWKKKLDSVIQKCFKKVRVGGRKKESEASKMIHERAKLKLIHNQSSYKKREKMAKLIEEKEDEIKKHLEKENSSKVFENLSSFADTSGTCNTNGMWKQKKKLFPSKRKISILAKKNEKGKLITHPAELKELYLKTFVNRLRHRRIKPGFENLRFLKEYLCGRRLELTAARKSPKITRKKFDIVLKQLKNNKARDPHGLINELFKFDVIGNDLKESLFLMCRRIKDTFEIPELLKYANITSIYKGKGAKNDLQNERGIFCINIFRSLILKIIYNEEYENIDENMSDSNVGGRKRKNIRNHLFVVNGLINEAIKKGTNIDIEILDYKECFDSMWLEETVNDLYETGLNNDNLNIIYNLNKNNKVAVATPHGLTDRVELNKLVMQGENLAPLECSVQIDTFGKECLTEKKYLFYYRESTPIPPLSMVDDLLCISTCGVNSLLMNSFIKSKSNFKKLQFGVDKCHKIHVGKNRVVCPSLNIDKWKIKQKAALENNDPSVEDIHDGDHTIQNSNDQKYLGDVICNNGRNDKNITARVKRGIGIIQQITSILEEIYFGKYHFVVAKILRESLFINSILLNSDVWYNLTNTNIEDLEKLDNKLLRKILEVGQSVPTAFIHLELGTRPLRFIIKTRRIMFLQYILRNKESSLLSKFLAAQMEEPLPGDWWLTVKSDLEDLELGLSLNDIKTMSKNKLKTIVNSAAEAKSLSWLLEKKVKSEKVKNIPYRRLELQNHLAQPLLTLDQTKFLIAARSKMLFVRENYPNMHNELFCPLCTSEVEKALDSQEHLLYCKIINMQCKDIIES